MTFEEHCKESVEKFGKPYKEVHRWLDEFAHTKEYGMKHRKVRHHLQGIKEVEKIFGMEAGEVARVHIISDLKLEGWKEETDPFPKNEKHYVSMGLY